MGIGMGVLIGSVSTAGLFATWLWIIAKSKGEGLAKIHQCWDTANSLSERKLDVLDRIEDQLRIANNIAQHR